MRFDILTPVFESGTVLESCISSVEDQGDAVRHIIQDGGSADSATLQVLGRHRSKVISQPDAGMYDALNRSLKRGDGDIIGHLNADEQYLPEVLSRVRKIFAAMPDVDVVCGDMVLSDSAWKPLSYRRSVLPPAGSAGVIPLPVPTCGMFFRRRLFDAGLSYRADLRAIADALLVQQLIQMKVVWYFDPIPYAVFSIHDKNLSNSGAAERDRNTANLQSSLPRALRCRIQTWIRKWARGAYQRRDVNIMIYPSGETGTRVLRSGKNLGWDWPKHSGLEVW